MTTELLNDTCTRCRKGKVSPLVVDAVYAHEGESVSFKDEFMRCDACEREFYTNEQSMAKSRAITAALRKHQGFMTGDEIRNARLSYGLSLADFEKALGVGKNTVGRWERNTVPPTRAANFGLWVAVHEPDVFVSYARGRGINIKRRSQRTSFEAMTSQGPTNARPLKLVPGKPKVASNTRTLAGLTGAPGSPEPAPATEALS